MLGQTLIKREIGDRLRQARLDAGFANADDFCARYNIPPVLYEEHESGERAIKVSSAQLYCHLLSITLNWLMLGRR